MATATEFVVATNGDDANRGTADAPFRTINRAAELAMPGDTITVREGIYREWVKPARGGTDEDHRIVYRAEPGADVRILGSEPATGWELSSPGLWKLDLPASRFGEFNPFAMLTRQPEFIEEDESGDGWGWLTYGRWTHLGDVFINGEGLVERETLEELTSSPLSWHTDTRDGVTTIRANFGDRDPNANSVELNQRPFAFFPERPGLSYITVRGFTIMNVACHWVPPTVFQPGAVGSNGGHHWVIEDNILMYAKAVAISVGNPSGNAEPAQGGRHVIRNNVILRAGQAGIAGQQYVHESVVSDNHIEDTNYRREFGGWETAAIKFHMGDGLRISRNFIRRVGTIDREIGAAHGIWNDFRNTNWQVDSNIVIGAERNAILTEANWAGPNLYSNNILVGGRVATYSSRGDAWVHNLIIDAPQHWENQDWGGRIACGNTRWLNNVFIGAGFRPGIEVPDSVFNRNVYVGAAEPYEEEQDPVVLPARDGLLQVDEVEAGVVLRNPWPLDRNFPLVTNSTLGLRFSRDMTVDRDLLGEARSSGANRPGPWNGGDVEQTEVLIYEYPLLYWRALKLIDGDCRYRSVVQ